MKYGELGFVPLSLRYDGDGGHGWMDKIVVNGWSPIPAWGRDGWDLGSWPLVIVAHATSGPNAAHVWFGLAVFIEGDIDVAVFKTKAERDAATDWLAARFWTEFDNGPDDRTLGFGPYMQRRTA